ncbi:MAG: inositol monophosphatase family protein [Candidatus Thorarchaeota archaeon]|jgi:histidinol phosphatase-like enzyme (inositol monophosphatase family)
MDALELKDYLGFAVNAAVGAGKITSEFFLGSMDVDTKTADTPVTEADRMAEVYIRERIEETYPSHSILGEEAGEKGRVSDYRWIIDPIDGTQSFIRGVPLYTVLIALEVRGEPLVGVIHNPPLQETVAGATGVGCFYNGAPCQVSSTSELEKAWVQVTDYADLVRRRPKFTKRLLEGSYSCRTWGDAYGYLLVATGRVDVMIDPIMKIWDIAPLKPIISEARGVFTDLDGTPNAKGDSSIACNNTLHKQIMRLV